MTIETLKSPNPGNRNSISVIKSKFLSVSSMNTLLAILKVTDARRDVILAGGLYHRFPWRHLPPLPPARDLYFCEYLITHFLQGFSEIFLQEWSKYVCQTAFGEVVCKLLNRSNELWILPNVIVIDSLSRDIYFDRPKIIIYRFSQG